MHVVILGCGYIGLEVARRLDANEHEVIGVRRSESRVRRIRDAGFTAVQADLTDPASIATLPGADWIVYTASVGRGGTQTARDIYVDGLTDTIETYAEKSPVPDRLIYTSSTGVYGDHDGNWVDETTPPRPGGQRGDTLLEAEEIALDRAGDYGIDGTVVRFGGLYGPSRYRLERYLTKPAIEGYRNSTHRHDGAGAIAHLLEKEVAREELVLAVDDEPVDNWAFSAWLADKCGESPPPQVSVEEYLQTRDISPATAERLRSNKRCSNDRLYELGYEIAVPSVWEGYQDAIEQYRSQ